MSSKKPPVKGHKSPSQPPKPATPATEEAPTTSVKFVRTIASKDDLKTVLTEAGSKLILIEFFAEWCGPCRMIAPRLEELAQTYKEKLVIIKVDVEDFEEIALDYEVSSMPTFMFFKNNLKVIEFVGSNFDKVEGYIEKTLGEAST